MKREIITQQEEKIALLNVKIENDIKNTNDNKNIKEINDIDDLKNI